MFSMRKSFGVAVAAVAMTLASSANAIVVIGGPIDHPYEIWVGSYKAGSAVAVGQRKVLTAAHLKPNVGSHFVMHGEHYHVAVVQHLGGDVAELTVSRDLAGWHRVGETIALRQELIVAGTGRRADEIGAPWGNRGYAVGRNSLTGAMSTQLHFMFDENVPGEALMVTGDSGGGVFVKAEDEQLELIGLGGGMIGPMNVTYLGTSTIGPLITVLAPTYSESSRDAAD